MRRREFIGLIGGAAAWPVASVAQSSGGLRRVGALIGIPESDPEAQVRLDVFRHTLRELGWVEGRDIRIDYRAAGVVSEIRAHAAQLASLRPDVIMTNATPATDAVRRAAPNVPIVFVAVSDPIGAGFVESLARPGGNITGFTNFEPSMGGKWVELVREVAPAVTHVSMIFNPETANTGASGGVYLRSAETASHALRVQLLVTPVHDTNGIDRAFATLGQTPRGGAIVMPNVFITTHRARIIEQAAQHGVPTVYPYRYFVVGGGLLSYGVHQSELFRRAAAYVDRILKGAKPADLPVEAPIKFELVVNLKTAKALNLTIPELFLLRADEVIE